MFEQWQLRPGQRMHIRLPVERWVDQIVLPTDAVVVDGPNVFVFVEHHHHDEHKHHHESDTTNQHATSDLHESDGEDKVFVELEPVPVHMLHRDDTTVVIADDGQLHTGEEVALNNAYKLYLAMKMQTGDGGGHHHHHDH